MVWTNANTSSDSSQINELLEIFVLPPPPRVNTIPKSCAVPVLPSPSLINLSATVYDVVCVVVIVPETVKSPVIVAFPLTDKLSPIVTCEFAEPMSILAESFKVPIFKLPVSLEIYESLPSWYNFISLPVPIFIVSLSCTANLSACNVPVINTCLSAALSLPIIVIIVSPYEPISLWSVENVVTPFTDLISIPSPFSPELSLTIRILDAPSDGSVDLTVNNALLDSIEADAKLLNTPPTRLIVPSDNVPSNVILLIPLMFLELSKATTFSAVAVPEVTPVSKEASDSLNVVEPITTFPDVVKLPETLIFLSPETSKSLLETTTFSPTLFEEDAPSSKLISSFVDVTPFNIFNSAALDNTATLFSCKLAALISPDEPYITALLFTTVPASEPSTKLSSAAVDVTVEPSIWIDVALSCPASPYIAALLLATTPGDTPVNLLMSSLSAVTPESTFNSEAVTLAPLKILSSVAVDVTSVLPICNLLALTSPFAPYITAFELEIAPADEPSNLLRSSLLAVTPSSILSSAADEVTRTPASSKPPSTLSCETIFNTWLPPAAPIAIRPLLSWVITFPLLDCPSVMPPIGATVVPDIDVVPITILSVAVRFLIPDKSLLLSTVNTLPPTTVPAVTPSKRFISSLLAVTPSRIFNSSADDVTLVPPISSVDTCNSPATLTSPLANVTKAVSSLWPIVLLPTTTLDVSIEPPDIVPVVLIVSEPTFIEPKLEVIEPLSNAPTWTILELPALTE